MTEKKQLGRILLKQRAISPEELEKELHAGGGRLASRLTEKGTISGLAALKALSEQHGIPGIDLEQVCVKLSDLDLLPREIAQRHLILPVLSRGERLFVAMANPKEKKVIDELEFVTGKRVYPYVALERPLSATIEHAYARKARGDDYFIGPRCPAETLAKLGLSAEDIAQMSEPVPSRRTSSLPPPRVSPDDDVGAADAVTMGSGGVGSATAAVRAPTPSIAAASGRDSTGLELEDISEEIDLDVRAVLAQPVLAQPVLAQPGLAALEPTAPSLANVSPSPAVGQTAPMMASHAPTVTFQDHFALADDTPLPPQKPRVSGAPASKRSLTPPLGHQPLGVTIDKAADEPDVSDEDFGDLNSELSVVMDIPAQPTGGPATSATVLVVDDEAEIRRMLDRLLVGKGYRVLQADDGALALRMVKEHTPDLILLDAMLPTVHGFDIARRIKGSKRYGHIPIVMVSAVYRGWHYAEDLKASCGVEAFLEKPFKIAAVVEAVEAALAGKLARPAVDLEAMHQKAEEALKRGVASYKEGRLDEAIAFMKSGVDIDPLAYRLHFHLGLLFGRKGQIFDAIAALEQAVGINPRHFPAVKNLAILYQKAGFKNKAAETWHKAAVIAPDDTTRESVKKQLMSLL
jgi:DNA-binding response OmpR family regulator